ncbi:MAG: DNA repair protein RecO [Minisyncoccia bacterium]
MEYYSTEAFILKKEITGEKDNVYHFFTKDYGHLDLLAKGTRDILAKLSGHLELPSLVDINFALGYRPKLITALEKNPYLKIKHDPQALKTSFKILNLVDELIIGNQKDTELFQFLSDILYFLENNLNQSKSVSLFSELYFEAQFLKLLGYQPFLDGCVECGYRDTHYFSFSKRGLVCSRHFTKGDLPISLEQKKYLKALFNLSLGKFTSLSLINQILEEKKFLSSFLEQFTLMIKFDILNK